MSASQSKPVTKARVFEPSELNDAFKKIDVNNCYELVRGAVGAIAYFGANRIAEIKEMTMSGNLKYYFQRHVCASVCPKTSSSSCRRITRCH